MTKEIDLGLGVLDHQLLDREGRRDRQANQARHSHREFHRDNLTEERPPGLKPTEQFWLAGV